MKRQLFLPLLALPLLFLSCDNEIPTEPAADADALFDVTTEGLVTNTVQITGTCSSGVTGKIVYVTVPSGATNYFPCPGGSATFDASTVTAFRVGFTDLNPAPIADCANGYPYFYATDFQERTKCTVNGRDVGGKPLAKAVMKYVK